MNYISICNFFELMEVHEGDGRNIEYCHGSAGIGRCSLCLRHLHKRHIVLCFTFVKFERN